MTNEEILDKCIIGEKYYTNEDLRYNKQCGILLNKQALDNFIEYKENIKHKLKKEMPLISWNSKKIFYYNSTELLGVIKDFLEYHLNDLKKNNATYIGRNPDDFIVGTICSELEGTLKIEGVNTTRRQIADIIKKEFPSDINQRIVINMYKGLKYIFEVDDFNKDTLKELYNILSDKCLKDEYILNDRYYRNDMVYIAGHNGCPVDKIEDCMNSLFDYVNEVLKSDDAISNICLPFIAHYYIVYIHPYFDYNGRIARMVQLWLMRLTNCLLIGLSEAINDNKNDYYKAIDNTRYSKNDLTYFLIYLFKLQNNYALIQKNIEDINNNVMNSGESLSANEIHYLKRIIHNKDKVLWFNYKKFMELEGLDITKQGALKILNKFESFGFLETKINSKKEKIFKLNESILKYESKE